MNEEIMARLTRLAAYPEVDDVLIAKLTEVEITFRDLFAEKREQRGTVLGFDLSGKLQMSFFIKMDQDKISQIAVKSDKGDDLAPDFYLPSELVEYILENSPKGELATLKRALGNRMYYITAVRYTEDVITGKVDMIDYGDVSESLANVRADLIDVYHDEGSTELERDFLHEFRRNLSVRRAVLEFYTNRIQFLFKRRKARPCEDAESDNFSG